MYFTIFDLSESGLWMMKVMKMSKTMANANEKIKSYIEYKDK